MEYIIDKPNMSATIASKDPFFRGLIVRCKTCVYFQRNPDKNGMGVCTRRSNEVVRRTDYCSRAKLDTGGTPSGMR